jgi:hemolysin III
MPPPDAAHLEDALYEQLARVKPRLRGWLHLGTFPVVSAAGLVLVVLAPTLLARFGAAVFTATGMLLFGVSAVFHRGTWSPRVWRVLRRLDHSNIFLLIAGTYTPFALLLLSGADRWLVLGIVWGGAVLGVGFRTLWVGAPRWLYTPVYLALGWVAVFWIDEFARSAGPAALALIVVGGVLYSLGGLVYGLKRPDPSPRWFGFHEIFHTLTIAAYAVHYVALSLVSYQAT